MTTNPHRLVWPVMAVAVVVIAANAWHAFAGRWNTDHAEFAVIWLFLTFVAAFYFPVWQRGGTKALKARFAGLPDARHRRGPIFWGVLAAVLVLVFLVDPESRDLLMTR